MESRYNSELGRGNKTVERIRRCLPNKKKERNCAIGKNLMKFTLYYSLLSLCVLSGCSNISSQNNHYIVNDVLESSYQDIDKSLSKSRSNLLFNNDEVANNCSSYFLLNSKYDVDESVYNQQVKSEYLICDALEIFLNSSSVTNSKINDLSLGGKLASKLDLRIFPSSLHSNIECVS